MTDCIFCKVVEGTVPSNIIYQDDTVIAFDDLYPKAPHHKLIIPRKHIATLNDITPEETKLVGHMLYTAQQLAKQLGIAEEGYRVVMNCNAGGGQLVYHIHLHLLGGRSLVWPPG
jgi:histidine triad (HIT) family protein